MLRVSAKDATVEMRTAILAMRRIPTDLRRDLNKNMRETFNPEWKKEISTHLTDRTDQLFLKGARLKSGNPPAFVAAASKRPLSKKSGGGLVPVERWAGHEYGSGPVIAEYTRRSPKGTSHTVRRNTTGHLGPRRKNGRVLGPSITTLLPRVSSFFAQSVIRTLLDALEEGR